MVYIAYRHSAVGANLFAKATRLSDDWVWNPTASAFQNAPAIADAKIALSEGSNDQAQVYSTSVTNFGSPAETRITIHDDASSDLCLNGQDIFIEGNDEVHEVEAAKRSW